jgi:hypothetical protein
MFFFFLVSTKALSAQPEKFSAGAAVFIMLLTVATEWTEVDTSFRSKGDSSLKLSTNFRLMEALKYKKLHTCLHIVGLRHRNNCI